MNKFTEYSRQHQAQVRKQLKEQCQTALSFLGYYNFVPSRIELYNHDTGVVNSFTFMENDELLLTETDEEKINETEVDSMNMWLYLKDKFSISNGAWRETSMKSDDPPCLNKITKHVKKLNQKWKIKPTPKEAEGVSNQFQGKHH